LVYNDPFSSTYKKYIFTANGRYLLGGMMIGDVSDFVKLVSIVKKKVCFLPSWNIRVHTIASLFRSLWMSLLLSLSLVKEGREKGKILMMMHKFAAATCVFISSYLAKFLRI